MTTFHLMEEVYYMYFLPTGKYLQTEPIGSAEAILVSETFFTGGVPWCLEFYYHMYGNDIGSLSVYVREDNGQEALVWERSGNQGNAWHRASVHIYKDLFLVAFLASGGQGPRRLIALDDITIAECIKFGKFVYHAGLLHVGIFTSTMYWRS